MLKISTWRNLAAVFGFLIAIPLIYLIVWMAVAGPVTVFRNLRYGDIDIDDYIGCLLPGGLTLTRTGLSPASRR